MLEQGFNYWFTDREPMRSPFPEPIRPELKKQTTERFSEWLTALGKDGAAALSQDELAETFEMFLFNVGMGLAADPDQKITMTYPFFPRCGDIVEDVNHGASIIESREVIETADNKRQIRLSLKTRSGDKHWQTALDLPA